MKIAVDAMGGDFAPEAIVEGVILAAAELPEHVTIVLIGKQSINSSFTGEAQSRGCCPY